MNVVLGLAVVVLAALLTGALLTAFPPLARAVLGDDTPGRMDALDGLRGILAMSVFVHHSIIAHAYFGGAPWAPPVSHFDNLLGRVAVALFFMVSAYLFWGRLVRGGGRLRWREFFVGRAKRIVPLYVAAVVLLLLIVGDDSDWVLSESPFALIRHMGQWFLFGFQGFPDINNVRDTAVRLSTLWSLRFEWIFYFSLPLLGLIYARLRRPWIIYVLFAAFGLSGGGRFMYLYFVAGALSVPLLEGRLTSDRFQPLWNWGALVCLLTFFWQFHAIEGRIQPLLLIPVFCAALRGKGPWSFLLWRPFRFLGHISYSVYLLHNPLMYVFITRFCGATNYAGLAPIPLYGVILLMGGGVILVASMTYLMIEKPCLAKPPAFATPAATTAPERV